MLLLLHVLLKLLLLLLLLLLGVRLLSGLLLLGLPLCLGTEDELKLLNTEVVFRSFGGKPLLSLLRGERPLRHPLLLLGLRHGEVVGLRRRRGRGRGGEVFRPVSCWWLVGQRKCFLLVVVQRGHDRQYRQGLRGRS
jgi:hypothetical protein